MQCVIKTHYNYDKHKGYHPGVTFKVPKLNLMRNPKVIHRYRRQILLTVTSEIPLLKAFIPQPFHFTPANYQGFSGCAENNGLSENSCKSIIIACLSCFLKPTFPVPVWSSSTEVMSNVPVENIPPWPSSKHPDNRKHFGKSGLAQE